MGCSHTRNNLLFACNSNLSGYPVFLFVKYNNDTTVTRHGVGGWREWLVMTETVLALQKRIRFWRIQAHIQGSDIYMHTKHARGHTLSLRDHIYPLTEKPRCYELWRRNVYQHTFCLSLSPHLCLHRLFPVPADERGKKLSLCLDGSVWNSGNRQN